MRRFFKFEDIITMVRRSGGGATPPSVMALLFALSSFKTYNIVLKKTDFLDKVHSSCEHSGEPTEHQNLFQGIHRQECVGNPCHLFEKVILYAGNYEIMKNLLAPMGALCVINYD